MRYLIFLGTLALGCGEAAAGAPVVVVATPTAEPAPAVPAVSEPEPTADPYADHLHWCEAIFKQVCECPGGDAIVCKKPTEPCPADRTGRAQRCMRPGWARRAKKDVYVCDPEWLTRKEQAHRRESQRVIVGAVCEPPGWVEDLVAWGEAHRYGSDPSSLCWHLPSNSKALRACRTGHFCQPDKLASYLALVAKREASWNNSTSHELNLDVEANKKSYRKAEKRGWYEGSPHFASVDRWERGYGWYGFNAALHTYLWDKDAPPEILCRQVESTEVYLRKARRTFQKLWSKYGDDKPRTYVLDTGEEVQVRGVTWYDIHRAASSGKLVPEKIIRTRRWSKKKQKWRQVGFVTRARGRRIGLDPFETVMWEMLGKEIPADGQNEAADDIRLQVERHFAPVEVADGAEPGVSPLGG